MNTGGWMFTIEHEFDATVVRLVDEAGEDTLREDVIIAAFEDCVTVTLSMAQLRDLSHALNLPEGSYQLLKDAP